jgi:hypothetical protein
MAALTDQQARDLHYSLRSNAEVEVLQHSLALVALDTYESTYLNSGLGQAWSRAGSVETAAIGVGFVATTASQVAVPVAAGLMGAAGLGEVVAGAVVGLAAVPIVPALVFFGGMALIAGGLYKYLEPESTASTLDQALQDDFKSKGIDLVTGSIASRGGFPTRMGDPLLTPSRSTVHHLRSQAQRHLQDSLRELDRLTHGAGGGPAIKQATPASEARQPHGTAGSDSEPDEDGVRIMFIRQGDSNPIGGKVYEGPPEFVGGSAKGGGDDDDSDANASPGDAPDTSGGRR